MKEYLALVYPIGIEFLGLKMSTYRRVNTLRASNQQSLLASLQMFHWLFSSLQESQYSKEMMFISSKPKLDENTN